MDSKVLGVVEEQIAVQFTGKVNILATFNRQFLGHILFKNGEKVEEYEGRDGTHLYCYIKKLLDQSSDKC